MLKVVLSIVAATFCAQGISAGDLVEAPIKVELSAIPGQPPWQGNNELQKFALLVAVGAGVSTQRDLLRLSRSSECLCRRAHGKGLMRSAVVVAADPVSDSACCVLDAIEALAMGALLFQCPDDALDYAILLRAVCGDELVFSP